MFTPKSTEHASTRSWKVTRFNDKIKIILIAISSSAIEPDYVSELYEALTKKVELGPEPMQVEAT